MILVTAPIHAVQKLGELTTPNGTDQSAPVLGYENHNFAFEVRGLSTNIVVMAEGSHDKVNVTSANTKWFNLDDKNRQFTVTAGLLSSDNIYVLRATNRAVQKVRARYLKKTPAASETSMSVTYEGN